MYGYSYKDIHISMQISKNENIDNSTFRYLYESIDMYATVTLPDVQALMCRHGHHQTYVPGAGVDTH